MSLARPFWWIDETPRNSDGAIWLEFEELGIANWANVLSVNECPESILGDGRLVTGTFQHSAANVIELTFSHSEEAIRSTSNHPFWSEDRQEFVQAGELAPGEHVRLLDGSTSSLTRAVPLEEEFPVFNLEVDGEHVYYVGLDGVLVHNAGRYTGKRKEQVYVHLDKDGNVNYIGITDNLKRRAREHARDAEKTGEKMKAITGKLSHDEARTIEAKLIRKRLDEAEARELIDGTEPIKEQLEKAGLLNKNRGRIEENWLEVDGVELDVDDFLEDFDDFFDIRT